MTYPAAKLRLGVFGQTGPYAPVALHALLRAHERFEVVLVVEGLRRGTARGEVHRQVKPSPGPWPDGDNLTALARAAGRPVLQTSNINGDSAVTVLRQHSLDWVVCVGFDRLFKPPVLECARRGGINAHPSLLPALRGPSPLFWALRNGLTEVGVTLHALDRGEDHGPIYAQRRLSMPPRASGAKLFGIAGELAGRMLIDLLERASRGPLRGTPQDHAVATRAPRPKPDDAFVDPLEWDCEHLVRFACGAPFFRPAWFRLGSDTFFARRGLRAEPGRRLPAQYVLHGSTLVLQCRDGVAQLEIQV
jgi:methionyl-tRNA formyltransferase